MTKRIGILTAGGDCPGLNPAIRAIGKTAESLGMEIIGFRNGFRGLYDNSTKVLDNRALSGIICQGGTILGTGRDKPHKMLIDGELQDGREKMLESYKANNLDVLVCIGGGGTQKNAYRLMELGMNVVTLPKTIDNDVSGTDMTFGYDTSLGIATDCIDRLHSTAESHNRIMVVEIMGNNSGWLALGAGVAGGADVILIPEVPYDIKNVIATIKKRSETGKNFSIVAIAEGSMPLAEGRKVQKMNMEYEMSDDAKERKRLKRAVKELKAQFRDNAVNLAHQLEEMTGMETRLTILGHLQRGGTPSAADRILTTQLGVECVKCIQQGIYGVMISERNRNIVPIPLKDVVGKKKLIPSDHPLMTSAIELGICLG